MVAMSFHWEELFAGVEGGGGEEWEARMEDGHKR